VVRHPTRLAAANALEILRGYDVIADGSDNFSTRYLVSDACVLRGLPDVYGSVFRFEGQVSVFGAPGGPCYRCLHPEPPPPGIVSGCAEAGVLGVLPGVIGTLQGTEVLKLLLGIGDLLAGRLLLYDALAAEFREIEVRRDPACPACGEHRTIRELVDYPELCAPGGADAAGAPHGGATDPAGLEISPAELRARLGRGEPIVLLDVREPHEFSMGHLPGARSIPSGQLPARLAELDRAGLTVVYCHFGMRSAAAARLLREAGFAGARHLDGGMDAWTRAAGPPPKHQ